MGTDAWVRGRPTAGAEAAGARPRAADRQERHLSSEIGKGSSGPSRGASEGALPRARAQTSVLEDGEGPHPVLSPPGWGTIVAAAWATSFTLESASGHLSPSQPNTSQEPNQATASKLPNFQKAVAPRATGRLPIGPAPGGLAPRPHPVTWHRLCLGPVVRLSEDSGVHA